MIFYWKLFHEQALLRGLTFLFESSVFYVLSQYCKIKKVKNELLKHEKNIDQNIELKKVLKKENEKKISETERR